MRLFRALLCFALGPVVLLELRAAQPAPPGPPPPPTIIESGRAEMVSTDKESTFIFRGGVLVTGANLKITCDELVVVARRSGDPAATLGNQENFKSLVATGEVRIVQGDREALCGRAEVFPGEDKVVLTENPRVRMIDGSYEATGPTMILERGERRAIILGTPTDRPRLILPPIKDLGYEEEPKKKASGPAEPDGAAAKSDSRK